MVVIKVNPEQYETIARNDAMRWTRRPNTYSTRMVDGHYVAEVLDRWFPELFIPPEAANG